MVTLRILMSAKRMFGVFGQRISFAAILLLATAVSAHAVDEIQVYNAEIAKVGQWTFQLHLNYAFAGRKDPISLEVSSPIMRSTARGNGPMALPTGGRWASTRRLQSTRI
jgi:hypothetical protein